MKAAVQMMEMMMAARRPMNWETVPPMRPPTTAPQFEMIEMVLACLGESSLVILR